MATKAKLSDKELENEIEARIKSKFSKMDKKCKGKSNSDGMSGVFYFLGFLGALIYFMQAADSFGTVITGFLKSLVWPAYLVYELLQSLYGAV